MRFSIYSNLRFQAITSLAIICCAGAVDCARADTSSFFQSPYMWSEDEGVWTARLGIGAMITGADFADMEAPAARSDFDGSIAGSLLNITADLEYRMTEHISLSTSLGYIAQTGQNLARSQPLARTPEDINNGVEETRVIDSDEENPGRLNFFPVSASVLFYPAPYGAFRPYIGGGYHYTKVTSNFTLLDVEDTHGFLARLGADWWFGDDWGLNFDVRYHQMEFDADFSEFYPASEPDGPGGTTDVDVSNGTLALNPVTVNVGFNYRF